MRLRIAFKLMVLAAAGLVFIAADCSSKDSDIENKAKTSSSPAKAGMPLPLKVKGTQILNSKNKPVLLRGVNAACLEWTSDGEGHILETVRVAMDDWNVNIIRLPLSQDRWFGKAPEQNDQGKAYQALVKKIVDLCSSKGCYIMLDLHWSNVNEWGQNIGQHSMPDRNSVIFWKDFAPIYANHPAVLFDLYNEPHDVTWDVWLNGGMITDRPNRPGMQAKQYEAVGMQEMLDTVRSTGAKNVIVAGGLDWAYDFKGILDGRQLKDPTGNGVIYANHAYDNKSESVFTWIANMEKATAKLPVIVSEFGGSGGANRRRGWWGQSPSTAIGDDWLLHVLQAIQDHHWSFTAWDLHSSAGPTLIADWNYTPTPDFGVYVKELLLTGKLPRYTPPDLAKLAQASTSPLPESARIGRDELYGDWQMKADPNDRMSGSILSFAKDSEGRFIGQWVNMRSFSELEDVRFQDGNVTFTQTVRFGKETFKGTFAGTIEGDTITGTLTHGANQSKMEGKRSPMIPLAAGEAKRIGSELIGIWYLDVTTSGGNLKQRLKVNPDMSGMYGITPIDKITLEGDKVSFKVTPAFGRMRFEMNFEGKLEGSKLTGELRSQRGSQTIVGTKAGF